MRWTGIWAIPLAGLLGCWGGKEMPAASQSPPWDPFLDTVQTRTLHFFLKTADAATGLSPDRWPSPSPSSIAAVGFALTSYPVAAERGLLSRAEAAERVRKVLRFLWTLPQGAESGGTAGYKGFFYHFVAMNTGLRVWNCELSTIDTGLLLAGALFCQSYFVSADTAESEIRALADSLYRRVEWTWAMDGAPGIRLGWYPERGFVQKTWTGYDEAMILYILALGSPTYPVPETSWAHYTSTYLWATYQDQEFISFGPLFCHQYSHCWIDFRGTRDAYLRTRGIDYFENSRRATTSQRAYAIANPSGFAGYADSIWGLTACDGPRDTVLHLQGRERRFQTYAARGASVDWVNDDGTIAPTAAGGSLAFCPELSLSALRAMRNRHGDRLFREFGFADAFNMTYITPATPEGWYDPDYIGIDQGPIVVMSENLRTGLVWETMKKNPYVVRGLKRAGFSGGWLQN
ncbi:MAG TPA: glucoamylase family protein [Bacteroidota bacterium]|nr:glucoamylase family protein [Bacteroidota bacterium]